MAPPEASDGLGSPGMGERVGNSGMVVGSRFGSSGGINGCVGRGRAELGRRLLGTEGRSDGKLLGTIGPVGKVIVITGFSFQPKCCVDQTIGQDLM